MRPLALSFPVRAQRQSGASLVAAIFLLLLFGALAAYMLWFGSLQQRSTALDVTGARALQAARAGVEWGMYRLRRDHDCTAASSFALASSSLSDFNVTVACTQFADTNQQGVPVKLYEIVATACNEAACPSAVPGENYAERVVSVLAPCHEAACP
ncbi:hypothetical protein [Azospira restricta]|uniref:Agglutinin biogenesis protein MshP n=1 Tax=Azospira restricta TaxID=404405 RepID=A0A974Y584_9RHOO|nr:hypothetical protein [Azospira restricta]QRJ65091.1 agglutinin biogenesis protein MshP [Azospira restricta]